MSSVSSIMIVLVKGFPNPLMAMGPHGGLGNYTRTAEYSVEWVTGVGKRPAALMINLVSA